MTGIDEVDTQHKTLVDIINKISEYVIGNKQATLNINDLLVELMEYTKYHFDEEEAMFLKAKLDERHCEKHIQEHKLFIERATFLSNDISSTKAADLGSLLDFLMNWLAYHILVVDKNMAKQIAAIKLGKSPKEAYEQEEQKSDESVSPLLNALDRLIGQVSQKNKELLELNKSLELKVKERTKELEEANLTLKALSFTDELTNIPNRRLCMQVLNSFWNDASKEHMSLSCIMMDADHFKSVNDTYGHDMGDEVLRVLSRVFINTARNDDIVCRLGGDEFLIICQNTNLDGAMVLAKEIHKKVNELKIPTGSDFWHGSVSIGVATKTDDMSSCEELIKAADNGVYAAKKAGKNRIRIV